MVQINEIRIDQPDTDNDEYFELTGDASTSLDNLTYLVIGDGTNGSGVIEAVVDLSSNTINNEGFFLAAENTFSLATPDLITDLNFENNDNVTHLLVEGFTGSNGDDLDTDDDGTLDVIPWSSIVDSVALIESETSGEIVYSDIIVGPDGSFVPGHIYRLPDDSGNWNIGGFTLNTNDTPGTSNDPTPPPEETVPIYEIQGLNITSPLAGNNVTTTGIVTAVDSNGFYLQDPVGDGISATSDGIFVFTGSQPTVSVGDELEVEGTVTEFFPGGESTGNLSTTQITSSTVTILSSDNLLPDPILIGGDGRIPPTAIINPNGIEFSESLEGMLVTVNDAVAVSPTNRFGEIFTVVDNGQAATGISDRGTINISPEDFNPERVQIQFDDDLLPDFAPQVKVGDVLGDVTGVVSYAFGNFEVLVTEEFTPTEGNLEPETTDLVATETKLTVASYNVLNLDPNDADGDEDIANGQFANIANQIVTNLQTPDIIALQEIQDNSGSTDDGTTAADVTLQTLTDAIVTAGGVNYSFIDAPTNNNENGGQPGGNIRVAYLYNPARVNLVSGSVEIVTDADLSDGDAFEDSRKPLAATFEFAGEEVTLINNHFSSKSGSTPLFSTEPPVNGSEDERIAQAEVVNNYVDDILAANAEANVIVLGDLNEFEFETAVEILEGDILTNLTETLPEDERYTFIFQGNSQSLDHILVSNNLAEEAEFDIVHVNTEFADAASDHDPLIVSVDLQAETTTFAAVNDDDVRTFIDTPITIDVRENDIDDDDDSSDLQVQSISGANNGTVEINTDGTITFTPNSGFKGKEDFNYVLTDEDGNEAIGRVIVEVSDDLPTEFAAVDDNFSTTPGTPVTFDLLANDTDDDNDDSDLEITNISGASNGTVEINADGTITFTPNPNFRGKEDFYYTLTDDEGNTDTGRAIVTVSEEQNEGFTLQILHAADQEGGLTAIEDAVNFSAVIEGLANDFANTLRLSAGDIYIPGPFFTASDEVFGEPGIGDILINNALGFQAVSFGNHEFDLGTSVVKTLLEANSEIDLSVVGEPGEFPTLQGLGNYPGTAFPYLSSNLDFAPDQNLAGLVVEAGEEPEGNTITKSVVIDVNNEPIGVIGATTPILESISSPGDVEVFPADADDFDALAAIIQAEVDALTAQGIDKIVLLAHFQQISIEQEIAARLDDVDIVIAGGSNTLLANEDDPLRAGDFIDGTYPIAVESEGETVYVINTDGNYKYVGRLAVTFDANGVITEVLDESGVYATDDAGVDRVYESDVDASEVANPLVVEVTNAIADVVLAKDGNIFGRTEVFLNGTRGDVRTQETNLGNLTADANLLIAQEYDPSVVVSIKNGGGIRDNIGRAIVPPGGTSDDLEKTPPAANPLVGKETGDISQLDIENSLRFNNELTLLTVTVEELEQILEYAISATEPGATPGQFPQVGGLSFSFDPDGVAIAIDDNGNIVTEGTRIQNVALIDEAGNVETVLVENGEIVVDPNQEIRLVTLNFLAGGGDGYPFALFGENRVDLVEQPIPAGSPNVATFAASGTEQDALAEYLAANFPSDDDPNTPVFDLEDLPPAEDERIQNLDAVSEDTVLGVAAVASLAAATELLTNPEISALESNEFASEIIESQQFSLEPMSLDTFSAGFVGFDPTSLATVDDSSNGDLAVI